MERILLSIVTTSCLMVLYGCSTHSSTPKQAAQQFLYEMHADNLQEAKKYTDTPKLLDLGITTELDRAELKGILSRDTFQIRDFSQESTRADVEVEISAPNLSSLTSAFLQQAWNEAQGKHISPKEIKEMVASINRCPLYNKTVVLKMVKKDGAWKVASNNQPFLDTMLGSDGPLIR